MLDQLWILEVTKIGSTVAHLYTILKSSFQNPSSTNWEEFKHWEFKIYVLLLDIAIWHFFVAESQSRRLGWLICILKQRISVDWVYGFRDGIIR